MAGADIPSVPIKAATRRVLGAVFALGVSCVMTQLALMREMLGAFSGNEMVLGIVLGLWLFLMALGTWLGRTSEKLRDPSGVLVLALVVVSILPLLQVFALRAFRNAVFVRGAAVGVNETVASAFILLLPYCLVAGYALALACAILVREEGPAGIGTVYLADSLGSIAGGALFSLVLVWLLDHLALLALPAALNLATAFWVGRSRQPSAQPAPFASLAVWEGTVLSAIVGIAAFSWWLGSADALSTALQFQGQRVIFRANSPYGRLVLTESDGQFNLIENGVPLISSHNVQQVEETVIYAMVQRPEARRVLLVSGGVSGTAKQILDCGASTVDYVELDPLILKLGRKFLPENLADDRIRIINTDGRLFINQTGDTYDVVIVDVPDPSTAQLNRFYTAEFFAGVKRVLAKDGVLSFALGHYENFVSPELARMLASARRSLAESFSNALVIPGGRVFFLASDGPLSADIAARVEQRQLKPRLVNRHYLDAMLTPDRMADMQRAVAQPAATNKDFSPVIYFYHLRHWMSQFNLSFGVVQGLLVLLLGIYLVRLRGTALVLFASGFAGSALEVILLLAFQVLCGSVYHQVGVLVTLFMVGLALGAFVMNRHMPLAGNRGLTLLACAVGVYALLLPLFLPLLNRMGGTALSLFAVKAAIALLTLVLATLAGMQFPLANRLEFDGSVAGASRLYTADFVGAFLGALLASTLLIPLIGVTGVCLVTAGLNILGAAGMLWRKTAT